MLRIDSEFSQYIQDYFPEDKTITPEKDIASDLDSLELPAISLFSQTFDNAVLDAVNSMSEAINAGNHNQDKIKKFKWGLSLGLSNNLFAEWLLGWQKGARTGNQEIGEVAVPEGTFGTRDDRTTRQAQFNQPEAESAILRNRPAEEAIKARVNTLAKDVSDSEWSKIKEIILDAIKPQSRTENPISRRELLKRINAKLGDRKNRFKNRAETIARTELTFAYNAGRLDSYVRSGLVAGVRFSTIFDERRCPLCASRQGIVVTLDDVEGLARLAIPVHPRCRCVWSPVLKTEFEEVIKQPGRKIKDRKLVPGRSWLAGGILAAILIPEELFFTGLLLTGIKTLISKAGSIKLARLAIANKINEVNAAPFRLGMVNVDQIGVNKKSTATKTPLALSKIIPTSKIAPAIISPGIDLNSATAAELRSVIPSLTDAQMQQIIQERKGISGQRQPLTLNSLKPILDNSQYLTVRAIAKENYILNLFHPKNNAVPSAIWVNSGGIIPKNKAEAVFKKIKKGIANKQELINLLEANNINYNQLFAYAENLFERKYPI